MSTPLSEQTSAEKLEILGRKHAVSHFEKGNFVDSPNEEVQKWLDRNHVMTTQAEFDALYDAYCKGFQSYHVEKWISELTPEQAADLGQRLTGSDPVTSPLTVSVAQEASSVVPAPLVPEVVKAVVSDLETLQNWRTDAVLGLGEYDQGLMCGVEDRGFQQDGYSAMRYGYDAAIARVEEQIDETITSALTALRNYSPSPSPSVELLREISKSLRIIADTGKHSQDRSAFHMGKLAQEAISKLNAALA